MCHTRKYYVALMLLMLVLVLVSFVIMMVSPQNFAVAMPFVALYFTAVTGMQHYFVMRSAQKSPREFVKVFLGLTVGVLFLHLIVLTIYMFSHLSQPLLARLFLITFCVCYAVYLAFETTALVIMVRKNQ